MLYAEAFERQPSLRRLNLSFAIASYNILASAYIQRSWYPRTPAMVLHSSWRIPALVEHVGNFGTDIICLQEVEIETFSALRLCLAPRGYASQFARKRGERPDGCATFFRKERFDLEGADIIAYRDGVDKEEDSGNIALVALLRSSVGKCAVINTHLTWNPPGMLAEARRGVRQAGQLLAECENIADWSAARILAGDFNVEPNSEIVSMIQGAGFDYAHRDQAGVYTCKFNGQVKMIDYLFRSSALTSEPQAIIRIDERTILPCAEQPSDHVAVMARFDWKT